MDTVYIVIARDRTGAMIAAVFKTRQHAEDYRDECQSKADDLNGAYQYSVEGWLVNDESLVSR